MRVMLVEDSPDDAGLVEAMLMEATEPPLTCDWHSSRAAALTHLAEGTFDIVLLDLGLPDSQGLDTLNVVRKCAVHVPIIVLTGFDDERRALRALQLGAQDYLVKGNIESASLGRAIRYSIERYQVQDMLRSTLQELEVRTGQMTGSNKQVTRLQDDTVMMLAQMAEAHDETTGIHLLGMRSVTELIARQLGYSRQEARSIGQAAVLHDIGKVRVSERTLTKPGPLTIRERKAIENHPLWGEALLAGRDGFELAAQIARWHHERWDGAGYPDGLSSEQIPMEVAIASVADSYDAMIRPRPYKPACSREWTLVEIQRCSGLQFNPRVVEALTTLDQHGLLASDARVLSPKRLKRKQQRYLSYAERGSPGQSGQLPETLLAS